MLGLMLGGLAVAVATLRVAARRRAPLEPTPGGGATFRFTLPDRAVPAPSVAVAA